MQDFSSDSSRWRAVQTRDRSAHSAFVYAVLTTRIVCRPTCPSRLARRSNVRYYDTVTEALLDGFRSCKRCQPVIPAELDHDAAATTVRDACRLIENANGLIKLTELATATGFSIRHLHNLFRAKLGCTPAMYAGQVRQITEGRDTVSIPSPNISTMSFTAIDHHCGYGVESDILNDIPRDPEILSNGGLAIALNDFTDGGSTKFDYFEDFSIEGHVTTMQIRT